MTSGTYLTLYPERQSNPSPAPLFPTHTSKKEKKRLLRVFPFLRVSLFQSNLNYNKTFFNLSLLHPSIYKPLPSLPPFPPFKISQSVKLKPIYLSIHIHPSIYLSIHLSIYPYPSIHLYLPIDPPPASIHIHTYISRSFNAVCFSNIIIRGGDFSKTIKTVAIHQSSKYTDTDRRRRIEKERKEEEKGKRIKKAPLSRFVLQPVGGCGCCILNVRFHYIDIYSSPDRLRRKEVCLDDRGMNRYDDDDDDDVGFESCCVVLS